MALMATSRLCTTLRRVVYHAQDFNKCCVTHTSDLRDVRRVFSKKSILEEGDATAKKQRSKTVPVPKITLLSPDDSITVTVLEDAQRLAKRRRLTLVKISDLDNKTQRPVYKLMNSSVFVEEVKKNVEDDDKNEQKSKDTKLLYISAKIAQNDLLIKTRNVVKLLNKRHKVKIVITQDGINEDKTQSIIEDAVKNYGNIQRMPSKKNIVLLLINPVLNKNKDNSVDNKEMTGTINQSNNM
ncbi:translation initiation factor IF-3 [Polyergus mexicanus]|uniref:translation initiation factor IF-3 n=1 Tax=Polyergus mexicanus TaxID=615972 RepID=UPI0038B4974C